MPRKVHIGPKGGQYIMRYGKKQYLKNNFFGTPEEEDAERALIEFGKACEELKEAQEAHREEAMARGPNAAKDLEEYAARMEQVRMRTLAATNKVKETRETLVTARSKLPSHWCARGRHDWRHCPGTSYAEKEGIMYCTQCDAPNQEFYKEKESSSGYERREREKKEKKRTH